MPKPNLLELEALEVEKVVSKTINELLADGWKIEGSIKELKFKLASAVLTVMSKHI